MYLPTHNDVTSTTNTNTSSHILPEQQSYQYYTNIFPSQMNTNNESEIIDNMLSIANNTVTAANNVNDSSLLYRQKRPQFRYGGITLE